MCLPHYISNRFIDSIEMKEKQKQYKQQSITKKNKRNSFLIRSENRKFQFI